MPWYLGNSNSWSNLPGIIVPVAIWSAIWTGFALWYAARREEKGWFIFFILVHTAGIIEILYLIFVAQALVPRKPRRK